MLLLWFGLAMSSVLSFYFVLFSHPLLQSIMVVALSVSVGVLSVCYLSFSWFCYVVILAFMGGMMILFVYVASLIPNSLSFWGKGHYFSMLSFSFLILFASSYVGVEASHNLYLINSQLYSLSLALLMGLVLLVVLFLSVRISRNPYVPLSSEDLK